MSKPASRLLITSAATITLFVHLGSYSVRFEVGPDWSIALKTEPIPAVQTLVAFAIFGAAVTGRTDKLVNILERLFPGRN